MMMRSAQQWSKTVLLQCLLLALVACSGGEEKEGDQLLAEVHNKSLFLSDLEGVFPEGASAEDSMSIIKQYAHEWIRESLLLHEAERNAPSDLNIDELVRDYRASLLRNSYEQHLFAQDSTSITEEELLEFYNANKEQYQLETPILRCYFIKVPVPVPEADELRRLWNSNDTADFNQLIAYCNKHADKYLLAEKAWYKVEEISGQMPQGIITMANIKAKQDFSHRNDGEQYYLRVFEVKKRKEIAPLGYITEQAQATIQRSRRQRMLEQKLKEMYEEAFKNEDVEIHYDNLGEASQ